jgi:hypothetical protein
MTPLIRRGLSLFSASASSLLSSAARPSFSSERGLGRKENFTTPLAARLQAGRSSSRKKPTSFQRAKLGSLVGKSSVATPGVVHGGGGGGSPTYEGVMLPGAMSMSKLTPMSSKPAKHTDLHDEFASPEPSTVVPVERRSVCRPGKTRKLGAGSKLVSQSLFSSRKASPMAEKVLALETKVSAVSRWAPTAAEEVAICTELSMLMQNKNRNINELSEHVDALSEHVVDLKGELTTMQSKYVRGQQERELLLMRLDASESELRYALRVSC